MFLAVVAAIVNTMLQNANGQMQFMHRQLQLQLKHN